MRKTRPVGPARRRPLRSPAERALRRLTPVGPVHVSWWRLLWSYRKHPSCSALPVLRRVPLWRVRLWMVELSVETTALVALVCLCLGVDAEHLTILSLLTGGGVGAMFLIPFCCESVDEMDAAWSLRIWPSEDPPTTGCEPDCGSDESRRAQAVRDLERKRRRAARARARRQAQRHGRAPAGPRRA